MVKWFAYSIEFQARGPPHAHIIVSLVDHVTTAEQVDRICQAYFPKIDPNCSAEKQGKVKRLRDLVEQFMTHRPCEGDENVR